MARLILSLAALLALSGCPMPAVRSCRAGCIDWPDGRRCMDFAAPCGVDMGGYDCQPTCRPAADYDEWLEAQAWCPADGKGCK